MTSRCDDETARSMCRAHRCSLKETCADMDRETVVSSLVGSVSKEKRDRDQNVVQTSRNRQHLPQNP